MSDTLLTAKQVAAMLQVSEQFVRDHASGRRRPVIPSVKMGGPRRFKREEIEAFIRRCSEGEAA